MEYQKINSIYKRDEKNKNFLSEYSTPEIEYLKNNVWEFTEKIDGMNVRVMWDGINLRFAGKTDNAEIPKFLLERLQTIFTKEKFKEEFPEINITNQMILFGEGFGSKIQSGGKYIKNGVDFILFDILINNWWLNRENVEDIAKRLNLKIVKVIGEGTLQDAVDLARKGFNSEFGNFMAEGIVLKPKAQLFSKSGNRIIAKIKHKDFQIKKEIKK
jgi:ATP-dependent RNA circularization protein (DNA/RNA ligase family)